MKNYLIGLLGVLSGLLVSAMVIFLIKPVQGDPIKIETITPSSIQVYIDGAVNHPGVYSINPGDRINDLIEQCGGISEGADLATINLADMLSDGQKIHIPENGEAPLSNTESESETKLININTATLEELCELPGIGESKAGDIITYREEHGEFLNIRDILNVPGIGESIFDKIESMITIN